MGGIYYNSFIKYMHAGKNLLDYTNLLSPNDYKQNDKKIYINFKSEYGTRSKSRV